MTSDNTRGALLMMASMAAFTLSDTVMKMLAPHLPLFQTLLWRGILVCVILFVLAVRSGAFAVTLSRRDKTLVALRSLADMASAWFFLQALYNMPIANLTAILQALPLSVAMAAAVFLREPIGWRRLAAIAVGFAGVLIIVRPDGQGFDLYAGYALIAVALVTARELMTRSMTRTVPTLLVAFWNGAAVTVLGLAGTIGTVLIVPTGTALMLIVAAALLIVIALMMAVMAIRAGDLGFVASFRYTAILWALVLGFLAFGEWPDPLTLLGAGLIVATGLFALHRERVIAARSRAPSRR